jgi:hypothetical protein
VKADADTLSTLPDDPPAAGPDRALDALPPAVPRPVLELAAVADGVEAVAEEAAVVAAVVAEEDEAHPAASPNIAHISVAVTIRPRFLLASTRSAGTAWRRSANS